MLQRMHVWWQTVFASLVTFFHTYKWHAAITIIVFALAATGVGKVHADYQDQIYSVYDVYYEGEFIGTVNHPSIIQDEWESRVERAEKQFGHVKLMYGDVPEFIHHEEYRAEYDNDRALSVFDSMFHIQAQAFEVYVEDEWIGYVPDRQTWETIVADRKSDYVDSDVLVAYEQEASNVMTASLAEQLDTNDRNASASDSDQASSEEANAVEANDAPVEASEGADFHVLEIDIAEDVSIQPVMIDPQEVTSSHDIADKIREPKMEEKVHVVEEGDVLSSIALEHDMTLDELFHLNTELNEDTVLQIGDELLVSERKETLNVRVVEQITKLETIHYPTEIEIDDDMYVEEQRVKQEGQNGKKNVTYELTLINGQEVERNVMEEEILEEAVPRIEVHGGRERTSQGSGSFRWPAKGGQQTSGYGMRWGRMHNGMDIAGVSDRSIVAADHGRVETAGWHSGGYGNYVVINHNNGYKTLYAHLADIHVSRGDIIQKGESLGIMGSTGHSTGIHLHFEIHRNGTPVNPAGYVNR